MKTLLIFLLLPFSVLAQSFEVKVGDVLNSSETKDNFKSSKSQGVLRNNKYMGHYTLFDTLNSVGYLGYGFRQKEGLEIGRFKDYINFETTHVLVSGIDVPDDQWVIIHGLLSIDQAFYVLYSVHFRDRANKEQWVYAGKLSPEMVMIEQPILLDNYDEKANVDVPLHFSLSHDRKTLLMAREILDHYVTVQVDIKTFSEKLEMVYRTSINTELKKDFFRIQKVAIANDQNVYLYGIISSGGSELTDPVGTADNFDPPLLFAYDAKKQEAKRIEIANPEIKYYYDHRFFMTDEGEPVAITCYNAKRGETGYTMSHVDKSTLTLDWKYSGMLTSSAKKSIKSYTMNRQFMNVVDFQKLASGEYIFSMETGYNNNSYENSNPVILIGIDAAGTKLWENIIQKRYKIKNDSRFDSHQIIPTKTGAMVIYNDHVKNLSIPVSNTKIKSLKSISKVIPVGVEVDGKGNMKKSSLLNPGQWEGYAFEMTDAVKIKHLMYQFKVIKLRSLGRFEAAYGTINLN